MAEPTDLFKDLRVRNVSLHSRGKTENGSLYLTRHHLIFSYLPNATADANSRAASGRASLAEREVTAVKTPVKGSQPALSGIDDQRSSGSSDLTPKPRQKVRPKEIWLPYPIINHCMLRPSHAQGRAPDYNAHDDSTDEDTEDSAFPPVYGTNAYTRPSTDSANLMPAFHSPRRSMSPGPGSTITTAGLVSDTGKAPALRIRRRDFQKMAFHFHNSSETSPDDTARDVFYRLRSRCCVDTVQDLHAFHFKAPQEEIATGGVEYDARREFARMGIEGKNAEGPGSAWRISDINKDYAFSATYPSVLCVPRAVTDNILKYGGAFRSKARIPSLSYLHSNGGSITRSSQPMVGVQSKRNPQDERLVSEIFVSHTPQLPQDSLSMSPVRVEAAAPSDSMAETVSGEDKITGLPFSMRDTTLKSAETSDSPRPKIYGSSRRALIVDARPHINALANKATGGGIEDVSNYTGNTGVIVEREFLNIANIHAMRKSLELVVEAFGNSDYIDLKPSQELLRKSGWLGHISGLLAGADLVARVVGLGASHALVHCSDGWDRTAQVAALAEIMLDPYYRTLQGFITLVQKDFLSFGHKFNHRHGIQGSEKWFEIENERVLPSRAKEGSASEPTSFNAFGTKALTGARNWFDKNRSNIFRQQGDKPSTDGSTSRPPSPPPNPLIHAPPTTSTKPDSSHKVDTKEIAPIFHQFLDAVFQIQRHNPNSFEFNERFLIRLFYQAHSAQYGEFLFNTEKQRSENADKTNSVWSHFLSRKKEFINPDYIANSKDTLLFAHRQTPDSPPEVIWWSGLFGRKDEDMNVLIPVLEAPLPVAKADVDNVMSARGSISFSAERDGTLTGSEESTPTEPPQVSNSVTQVSRPVLEQRETDTEVLAKYVNDAVKADQGVETRDSHQVKAETESLEIEKIKNLEIEEGDPLGVSGGKKVPETTGLDFAAFARGNAYSDR